MARRHKRNLGLLLECIMPASAPNRNTDTLTGVLFL